MVKVKIKTNWKDLKKGTYKAKPKVKKYEIKKWQRLTKSKTKKKKC